MLVTKQAGWVLVRVTGDDTTEFNHSWPCSNIPNGTDILFELDARNGDLVNITMHLEDGQYVDSADYDGAALLALSHDANNFAVSGGHLPQWARR